MSGDEFIDPSDRQTYELVQAGSEIAGAAVGGALGLLAGPPGVVAGAAGGVIVTRALKTVGRELQERFFGPRERVRVGAAFAFAADEIKARLEEGDVPARDFIEDDSGRSSVYELLEGVLRASADAYEERKVRHLGWLYASLVFEESIDWNEANYLLRLARGLTYGQLCVLSFFVEPRPPGVLALLDGAREAGSALMSEALAVQVDDLGQSNILGFKQPAGQVVRPVATLGGGDVSGVTYETIGVTPTGQKLFRLMRLDRIPDEDIKAVRIGLGALD
jgi:hypothetical protein